MNDINNFVKAFSENPEARKMMSEAKEPANAAEAAELYAEIAEKAGISVTRETVQKLLEEKEKNQKAATAKAESAVKEALTLKDLDAVAGGVQDPTCGSSYSPGEWCWFSDSCSVVINYYNDHDITQTQIVHIDDYEWTLVDDCKSTQLGYNLSICQKPSIDDVQYGPDKT